MAVRLLDMATWNVRTWRVRAGCVFVSVLALVLAGCAGTRAATDSEYGGVRVGDVYEFQNGATVVRCEQFTFWSFPEAGSTDCILPREANGPEHGDTDGLPGPVDVEVYKIEKIDAVDYVDYVVYVRAIPGGKTYVAPCISLNSRVWRLPGEE